MSTQEDRDFINDAMAIATHAHANQLRKRYMIPYLIHPLRVASYISKEINDKVLIASALLHDAIEDGLHRYEYAARIKKFDVNVYNIVNELTCAKGTDKVAYMKSFKDKSIDALIIKLFDRYDNVYDFTTTDSAYASIYAGAADCIYTLIEQREKEISDKYGNKFALYCRVVKCRLQRFVNDNEFEAIV
jgi:(p)ppGpp synthase/HD superfamily hydrolase